MLEVTLWDIARRLYARYGAQVLILIILEVLYENFIKLETIAKAVLILIILEVLYEIRYDYDRWASIVVLILIILEVLYEINEKRKRKE